MSYRHSFKVKFVPHLLALAVTTSAFVARPAEALLLTTWSEEGPDVAGTEAFWCLFLIPFCLYDKSAGASGNFSTAQLKQNGYSDRQIARLLHDQQKIVRILAAQKKLARIQPGENYRSLRAGLQNIYPQVSNDYVNLVSAYTGAR